MAPTTNPWPVVLASSALGSVYGALIRPQPLVSLEAAQVVAGVVSLPVESPTQMAHSSSYSLFLIQLPAILLKLGLSEWTLSVLGSGMQGALAFAALSASVLAFSHNALLALLTPILLLRIPDFAGHKYPTELPTDAYDAGVVGFYAVLLVLALMSLRRRRSGWLLLGLLPSVHLSLGAAAWIGAAAASAARRGRVRIGPSTSGTYFLIGGAVTAVTFLVHIAFIRRLPSGLDDEAANRALTFAFEHNWDDHRQPIFGGHLSRLPYFFEVDVYVILLTFACLWYFRARVSSAGRFLLAAVFAITLVGIVYTAAAETSFDEVPLPVHALMMTRWLNFNSILLPLVIIGALGYLGFSRNDGLALAVLMVLVGVISVGLVRSETLLRSDWLGLPEHGQRVDWRGLAFPLGGIALAIVLAVKGRWRLGLQAGRPARALAASVFAVAILLKLGAGVIPDAYASIRDFRFITDRSTASDRALFARTATTGEPLLSAPQVAFYWPQLRTRRGLYLDPDLVDLVTYVPAAATETERVLNDVYGTSVHDSAGRVSLRSTKGFWEVRRRSDWREIAERFGVRDLLVPRSWNLRLPLIDESTNLRMYRVP